MDAGRTGDGRDGSLPKLRYMTSAIAALALALVAGASPAAAATTVGQVSTSPDPNNCPPFTALVTISVSAGTEFTVPSGGGVITSWLTHAGSGGTNVNAKLKIFRPTAVPAEYQVVGQSNFQPITASSLNGPFPVRIPVQTGDYVSILPGANGGPCNQVTGNASDVFRVAQGEPDAADGLYTTFSTEFTTQFANVSATLEPDADHDAFGDETQDRCVGTPGPLEGCPDNDFRLVTVNSLARGRAALVGVVPGPGRFAGRQATKGKLLLKAANVEVPEAGRVKVVLKPTARARMLLKKRPQLKVRVRATFTPTGGMPLSREGTAFLPGRK